MSGPRVTSGEGSKQDYGTDPELLAAVEKRFGKIVFDLAAHATNKVCPRYFAPKTLIETVDLKKSFSDEDVQALADSLVARGGDPEIVRATLVEFYRYRMETKTDNPKFKFLIPNKDPEAFALDALAHNWNALTLEFSLGNGEPSILWLNPEFSDIAPWASRCAMEGRRGANIVSITPAMVGSNWARDYIFKNADVYLLNGRVSFDGKNPFPKDCMIAHYNVQGHQETNRVHVWNWRKDIIERSWVSE